MMLEIYRRATLTCKYRLRVHEAQTHLAKFFMLDPSWLMAAFPEAKFPTLCALAICGASNSKNSRMWPIFVECGALRSKPMPAP